MKAKDQRVDWYLFLSVLALIFFGVAFVYSASGPFAQKTFGYREALLTRHLVKAFLSFAIILTFSKIDYRIWKKIAKPFLIVSIALLVFVLAAGVSKRGAARWVNLGFLSFQPSELAKFALAAFIAAYLSKSENKLEDFKEGLLPVLIWAFAVIGLTALQPNFSTAALIFALTIILLFAGGAKLSHLAALAGGFAFVGGAAIAIKSGYHFQRIASFLGFGASPKNLDQYGYQLKQSLIALGNGGLFGLGPGMSRQSELFLPDSYSDFIFSIIGEEYGFVGSLIIIAVYVFILWRAVIIAKRAPDEFGYYLSIGIASSISLNAFINIGVNAGLLPTTGLPLPFVSYGGTSMLVFAMAIGALLNVSKQAGVYRKGKTLIA